MSLLGEAAAAADGEQGATAGHVGQRLGLRERQRLAAAEGAERRLLQLQLAGSDVRHGLLG